MKAFPYGRGSDLVDKSNHLFVEGYMFKHSTMDWRVVNADGFDWIEADSQTEARQTLSDLSMAAYHEAPFILNEKHYNNIEYKSIVDAIKRTAEETGTIIVSNDDVYDLLSKVGVKFTEDPPMTLNLSITADEFKELIETTFPTWRDY